MALHCLVSARWQWQRPYAHAQPKDEMGSSTMLMTVDNVVVRHRILAKPQKR